MFKKKMVWALTIVFLFPVYSYAESTIVPDFNSIAECQEWVRAYAKNMPGETMYDFDVKDWLYSFAVRRSYSNFSCKHGACTKWFYGDAKGPVTGGCDMIGDPVWPLDDVWVIARRNLVDMISIYESELALLPEYRYGKECHYAEGSKPFEGECRIMMHANNQSCATLNPLNNRLHIPCLNYDGTGTLYWIEADLLKPWTFEISNVGSGFYTRSYEDDCATYTASTGSLFIPCVEMGDNSYWAEFEVLGTDPIQLHLKKYEKNWPVSELSTPK